MAEPKTYSKARLVVAWIIGIYAAILVLFNMPFMQKMLADWTANALSEQLNTKVEIESINVGFLNRVIINDLYVEDQDQKEMLKVARLSASIDIISLISDGKIEISSAQLFGAKANLYKKTQESDPNFKFVLDAFKSDSKESKPINLRINSLIVRHADVKYDVLSEMSKPSLDTNHLHIQNAGFNLSLKTFTPDSINVSLKRFQAKELNSNLNIKNLDFLLEANNKQAKIKEFSLQLPQTTLQLDSTQIHYSNYNTDKSFAFDKTTINGFISPSDLSFVMPSLAEYADKYTFTTTFIGSNNELNINELKVNTESISLNASIQAKIGNINTSIPLFDAKVTSLDINSDEINRLATLFNIDNQTISPALNLGNVHFSGTANNYNSIIESEGELKTDAGSINYNANLNNNKILTADFTTSDIDINRILGDERFGMVNMKALATLNLNESKALPVGQIQGEIVKFDFNGYEYHNITIDANSNSKDVVLKAISKDENINIDFDGTLLNALESNKTITATLNAININPHLLKLTDNMEGKALSFALNTNLNYTDINNLSGTATVNDFTLTSNSEKYHLNQIDVNARLNHGSDQNITLKSDFLDANVSGKFLLTDLAKDFTNIVAQHLPLLVNHSQTQSSSDIKYDLTFYDSPILHHLIDENYSIDRPINIYGSLDSNNRYLNLRCDAPEFTYNDHTFHNMILNCSGTKGNLMLTLSGNDANPDSHTKAKVIAIAHNNKIDTDIQLKNNSANDIALNLFATTSFGNTNGHLNTNVSIQKSDVTINDSIWKISPSVISLCNKQVECRGFKIAHGDQYIEINGKAAPNTSDSIIVNLNDMEVAYILDLINFHSVDFGGKASGRAIINNIYGEPDAHANLNVKDFTFEGGGMGDANIVAFWDKEKQGISIGASFYDKYKSHIGNTDLVEEFTGITTAYGYIIPKKSEIDLKIMTNNTRADFLGGFLGSIVTDIDGRINGLVNVVGPFSDINLIGNPTADIRFKLRATKVPYYISNDTINLKYHELSFSDIKIYDKQNNEGILNGLMTHKNLANFTYDFNVALKNLCAYNETSFNADKYMAQVWANGDIHIYGSDGHPITIDADVTPCKGSSFAYDSATPDALVSNSFIDFGDIEEIAKSMDYQNTTKSSTNAKSQNLSDVSDVLNTSIDDEYKYNSVSIVDDKNDYTYMGDLYMNVNIDLNPNCAIKLRMDNTPDGYITTYGNGTFQAKYYNKGSFQLFGNYNITSGKYRLYLQDLVYRNLEIQEGSKVEFNGNPFDANIHLICKHEINSVPLSDLTATKAFSSNNKVKVDCFLDITGHLDNMDLSFNFELPNVSEETRQLVRSMINSDEEMNKQMIYLLGFQRFYPNQLAQSNFEDYGTQAVNSLISSTISGQINQVLSSMIGSSSKWNFGTGITTGENGWQDLDVEGILSGRLLNDRLLINGNFGYRDNSLTNQANFIGDFEVKYRIWDSGDFYVKAYNQTNDRYFTKATLNTQGVGLSFQHDFERYTLSNWFRRKKNITVTQPDSVEQK